MFIHWVVVLQLLLLLLVCNPVVPGASGSAAINDPVAAVPPPTVSLYLSLSLSFAPPVPPRPPTLTHSAEVPTNYLSSSCTFLDVKVFSIFRGLSIRSLLQSVGAFAACAAAATAADDAQLQDGIDPPTPHPPRTQSAHPFLNAG